MTTRLRTARDAVVAVSVGTLAYVLFVGYRSDYRGHFLAGFGATLALLVVPMLRRPTGRWDVVAVVAAAILIGFGTEATIFRSPIFDPVDFFNQSMGACLAGCVLLGEPRLRSSVRALLPVAAATLVLGFVFAFA